MFAAIGVMAGVVFAFTMCRFQNVFLVFLALLIAGLGFAMIYEVVTIVLTVFPTFVGGSEDMTRAVVFSFFGLPVGALLCKMFSSGE